VPAARSTRALRAVRGTRQPSDHRPRRVGTSPPAPARRRGRRRRSPSGRTAGRCPDGAPGHTARVEGGARRPPPRTRHRVRGGPSLPPVHPRGDDSSEPWA
jgi:hypothetical protein